MAHDIKLGTPSKEIFRVTPAEAEEVTKAVIEAYPGFKAVSEDKVVQAIGFVIQETVKTNADIERRLKEAAGIPPDLVLVFMHYAALQVVIDDLPGDNDRRQLADAGRVVGRLIARKYGEKIQAVLEQKTTKN